ncbi:unnamed protein product, partial [Hymenolepis diminuta]
TYDTQRHNFSNRLTVNSQLLGGEVPCRQNSITLQTVYAFQAKPKYKNGEFAYRNSQNSRQQIKRCLMNNLEIVNPDTNSEYFSRFRGMRLRRERLDIFINVSH